MRLTSIAISNIRSFKFDPEFSEPINFAPTSTNLIIGPNASGKSNLVEVIKQLFTTIYDVAGTRFAFANDLPSLIRIQVTPSNTPDLLTMPGTFSKHRSTPEQPSSLKFSFVLDDYDIVNIRNFRAAWTVLSNLQTRYVNSMPLPETLLNEDLISGKEYTVVLGEKKVENEQIVFEEVASNPKNLGSVYLQSYGLVKTLVDIHNELLRPELFISAERGSPLLASHSITIDALGINSESQVIERPYDPVLFMSVQERLADIDFGYSVFAVSSENAATYQRIRQVETTNSHKSAYGNFNIGLSDHFESFKYGVSRICIRKLESNTDIKATKSYINSSYEPMQIMNRFLAKFRLSIVLADISLSSGGLRFNLLEDGKSRLIQDLSTGQRAILNVASTVTVGSETQALVLIDEIENHLHPTVQSKLREAIVELSNEKCQVVAVTHSPIFIDKKTLLNTLRVYMVNGSSVVHNCKLTLRNKSIKRAMIDVISLTKSARIFFANKVLLVEGLTDELFYSGLIRYLYGEVDLEVISTGSKQQLPIWRKIIEKFGIKVYTIADLDAAIDGKIKLKPGIERQEGISITWDQVNDSEHKVILEAIARKKAKGDFILSKGAIESYYPSSGSDKLASIYAFIESDTWNEVNWNSELMEILEETLGPIQLATNRT